ncbi:lipopolysaccharide biosynthesis protein [Galactobacillus timonensis]|uniref:lipopolysaccharide biosynthesis protein n=1 Tax=Galactobacillus timonensis TaxID=2041840 RepID=UPI00143681E4|nr:oligosaccharide flippase family protein [Galactobacillus timonensis]
MSSEQKPSNYEELKNKRAVNSVRNAVLGSIYMIETTLVPFFLRTLMARTIGYEYLGLNNLFLSIISMINFSELGIGTVMTYFLYRPYAYDEKEKVEAYLHELRKIYFWIGIFIIVVSLCLIPLFPFFVTGNIPVDANIYLLFSLYILSDALQYFFFPDTTALFEASERSDYNTAINGIANLVGYSLQIISLLVYKSYLYYIIALVIQAAVIGFLRFYYKRRYYSSYHPKGSLNQQERIDAKKRIGAMIGHQLDEKFFNSIDTVMISSFLGLNAVAVYGNYYYVLVAVTMLLSALYNGVQSGIGNAVAVESREGNYDRFFFLFWLSMILTGWATACMLCLYQNFIRVWMGDQMLGMDMVILLCVYFYLSQIRKTVVTFKNANGMWYDDRWKPYVSIALDFILDLVLIPRIGVIGAVISSIICLSCIELPWETIILFRNYFKHSLSLYLKRLSAYSTVNVVLLLSCRFICERFIPQKSITDLLIRLLVCSAMSIVIFGTVYRSSDEMKRLTELYKRLRVRR